MTKKWRKKITAENFFLFFFISKTAIYLSLGLHKVCPSYRRSLQLSKEAIQHFKTWTFTNFFYFCGSFLPSWIRIHRPDWIRIQSGSGPWSATLLISSLHSKTMFCKYVRYSVRLEAGFRIRIRIGSGFNRAHGSGSRRAKMTHKSRKNMVNVHVLKCWMASFESWRLLL